MQVHTDIEHIPLFNKAVITIGTFDGVHLGHQKILSQLKEEADCTGGETVIITFHPHPRKIIQGTSGNLQLINTIEERIELIAALGIQHIVVVPFTPSFSQLTPQQYVEDFLLNKFHPDTIIIGHDHRYGKERMGNFQLLENYSSKHYFSLKEIPAKVINDSTVSSTLIRKAILNSDLASANMHLGYSFFFQGTVIKGDKRGRALGFPTANLKVDSEEKIIPGNGVYAVLASINSPGNEGRTFKGMMNIGVRPTVNGSTRSIETHLFDFSGDIYGSKMKISIKKLLRHEQKFDGLDILTRQLKKDEDEPGFFLALRLGSGL
ncbi:MAG: bifunctional riboflavin kinase/FAD synthetase, partial [Flavitalea sp.]